MRYQTTASFEADLHKLTPSERVLFRKAVRSFNDACDAMIDARGAPRWPKSLRVKDVEAAPGIWEMTWSFSGPDGRATWEWTTVTEDGEELPAIRWRRIGNHAILRDP